MTSRPVPIGIDLGTSFSAVALVNEQGETVIIANATGGVLTPSVVLFEDDNIRVGAAALQARHLHPERIAENVKRDMGQPYYRFPIMGQQYPPEVIQSCILQSLREDIVARVGDEFQVVVTVPAYFDEARRKVTADAVTMSGLPLLDIVNEPTAAALAFGERLGYLTPEGETKERLRIVVYDLGGGTFDVTVIELAAREVKTLATDGDYELGGVHWDERLAEFAEVPLQRRRPDLFPLDDLTRGKLITAAHAAKHQLTSAPLSSIALDLGGERLQLPIRREDFEAVTQDLVERTLFTTNQALRDAGLLWHDIDRLLLVGGSTRMPMIRAALERASGLVPDDAVHPDEAVARGAAIFARNLFVEKKLVTDVPRLRITDVSSHGLGIEGINMTTRRVENITLIPRNTPLPCEIKRTFVTKTDNQRSIKVELLEGESTLPSQCSRLAVAAIRHLPPALPKGTPIEVTYTLGANGRLTVEAEVAGAGDTAHLELERTSGLDDEKVKAWKTILQRHGGYRDFEEALASSILFSPLPPEQKPVEQERREERKETPTRKPITLNAAIEHGAPKAASTALKEQSAARVGQGSEKGSPPPRDIPDDSPVDFHPTVARTSAGQFGVWLRPLMHVAAGMLGIVLGYYALCLVRPDLNFLHLSLPGVESLERVEPEG